MSLAVRCSLNPTRLLNSTGTAVPPGDFIDLIDHIDVFRQ